MKERNNIWRKRLDKWIGCPLLFMLGFFHQRRQAETFERDRALRIVLVKTAAIGDTILLSAVVDEIKQQYTNSHVTVICSNDNLPMVRLLCGVDDIFVFRMNQPVQSFLKLCALQKFDLLLDFGPWPRINAIISWMVRANYTVGFKRSHMYRHYAYDKWVEHLDTLHEMDNYRNILQGAGIQPAGRLPHFEASGGAPIEHRPYVVFHQYPGGSMEKQRKWPEARWVELGQWLHQKYRIRIMLSGAPSDRAAAEHMESLFRERGIPAESIAGVYSLGEMIDVLAKAELVISVNTGIMHLAAAVRVPLIALHGATSELRWGPLSDRVVVVKSGEACQPCISLGFESKCTDPVCMRNITVDMVADEIERFWR